MRIEDTTDEYITELEEDLLRNYLHRTSHKHVSETEVDDIVRDFDKILNSPFGPREYSAVKLISTHTDEADDDLQERMNSLELKHDQLIRKMQQMESGFNKRIRMLIDRFEERSHENAKTVLRNLGFEPLTEAELVKFDKDEVLRCKKLIKQEIQETNGYTDASVISQKYELPLKLVAGCFDSMLKEGEIGEIDE